MENAHDSGQNAEGQHTHHSHHTHEAKDHVKSGFELTRGRIIGIVLVLVVAGVAIFLALYHLPSAATNIAVTTNSTSGSLAGTVVTGDQIEVSYVGSFTNGTVFDSSARDGRPLNFTVGAGQVIAGFDQAVVGMGVNQSKTVTLPPAEAYGAVNPSLFIHVPTNVLTKDLNATPVVGMSVTAGASGQRGIVTSVNATNTTLDFNPPLAGKTLIFNITVVAILKKA